MKNIVEIVMDNGVVIKAPIIYDETKPITATKIINLLLGRDVKPGTIMTVVDENDFIHSIFISKVSHLKMFKGVLNQ